VIIGPFIGVALVDQEVASALCWFGEVPFVSALVRFRRLARNHQWLVVEAAMMVALASAAIRLMPFRRSIRFGAVALARRPKDAASTADCVWAVEASTRRLPWRTVCIQKGIALQRMLRKRGIDARLHYGARTDPLSGELEAHVWVTVGGEAVIGGAEAANFAEVAVYP
jgi:hypothetical protein